MDKRARFSIAAFFVGFVFSAWVVISQAQDYKMERCGFVNFVFVCVPLERSVHLKERNAQIVKPVYRNEEPGMEGRSS